MNLPGAAPDGVLPVRKSAGMTSHDVVERVRRLLRVRAGHTGTLDPAARGLLPVALGEATKLTRWLSASDKRYRARVRLGSATDTLDAAGQEVARAPVPPLEETVLRECCARFVGTIEQVPPMHSAIRVGGKRLYQLARRGVEVERAPRRVRIERIELVSFAADTFEIDVRCSAGTYIRALAADMARALGTVGHLAELERTEAAGFKLEQAVAPDEPEQMLRAIEPLERLVRRFRCLEVPREALLPLARGREPRAEELAALGLAGLDDQPVVLIPPEQAPMLVLGPDPEAGTARLRILRVLRPERK
ncbi:MAG: tRNA pseudouridine(55) synthase TruB [Myxococcales bacterium]|nr:tRNA pseudouridine(55) synthase TruB [Myxococcales bacterium]